MPVRWSPEAAIHHKQENELRGRYLWPSQWSDSRKVVRVIRRCLLLLALKDRCSRHTAFGGRFKVDALHLVT